MHRQNQKCVKTIYKPKLILANLTETHVTTSMRYCMLVCNSHCLYVSSNEYLYI